MTAKDKVNKAIGAQTKTIEDNIATLKEEISKSTGGMDLITPDKVAIKEERKEIAQNDFTLIGNSTRDQESVQRRIEQYIEKSYKEVSKYTLGGAYKDIWLAKQNAYVEREFPVLDKSNSLFTTDICFGSFFGAVETQERFRIYENGQPVEDTHVKEMILNIINPEGLSNNTTANVLFDDIDFEATKLSRRDKKAFVRLVANKDVMLELYVKYCMKKVKTKNNKIDKPKVMVTPSSFESVDMISQFAKSTFDTKLDITDTTNLCDLFTTEQLELIPKFLVNTIHQNSVNKVTKFEEREIELYSNESFQDFCHRALTGKLDNHTFYVNKNEVDKKNEDAKEDKKKVNEYTKHIIKTGSGITSYSDEICKSVLSEVFGEDSRTIFSMESNALTTFLGLENNLSTSEKDLVCSSSFNDIYNLDVSYITDKLRDNIKEELIYSLESRRDMEYTPNLHQLSPLENIAKKIITDHSDNKKLYSFENELLDSLIYVKKPLEAGLEATAKDATIVSGMGTTSEAIKSLGDIGVQIDDNVNERLAEVSSRTINMFKNITGVNTILLDNTRIIPNITNGKHLGVFYIEKTHSEIEHLIGVRTTLASPSVISDSDSNIFQVDEATREETMARLVFTDSILPFIEENMSTKFLRDNVDILYTIKTLLEETELSNRHHDYNSLNGSGMMNMSKISYIPARELVMYTNGPGNGTSVYEKAFVPAMSYVLANEAQLSYILFDGKGYSIIEVPKGLSDESGEYGAGRLVEQLKTKDATRMSLKSAMTDSISITKPKFTIEIDDHTAGKINVTDVQPPEFHIDPNMLQNWQEDATGIVGYPASLFGSTQDNKTYDNLKKLESMNSSIILDILKAQNSKRHSSNLLANKLLHLRGGKSVEKYSIEWIPPRPSRTNTNIKKEILTERKEAVDGYLEVIENIVGNNPDFENMSSGLKSIIAKKIFADDTIIQNLNGIIEEAMRLGNSQETTEINEI